MTTAAQGRVGFAGKRGRVWSMLASWVVPVMMTGAYIVLMWTSETNLNGKIWMAVGLVFVLVLWSVFRILSEHAALSRAVNVGDTERVLEITDHQLRRKRGAAAAPLHIYRALAYELRGDWTAVLSEADRIELGGMPDAARKRWRLLAACARIGALVETGRAADARRALDEEIAPTLTAFDPRLEPAPHILGRLAKGRVLVAENVTADALAELTKVIDDVRAGQGQRAVAHHYASRITLGPASDAHRENARKLLPTAWFAKP